MFKKTWFWRTPCTPLHVFQSRKSSFFGGCIQGGLILIQSVCVGLVYCVFLLLLCVGMLLTLGDAIAHFRDLVWIVKSLLLFTSQRTLHFEGSAPSEFLCFSRHCKIRFFLKRVFSKVHCTQIFLANCTIFSIFVVSQACKLCTIWWILSVFTHAIDDIRFYRVETRPRRYPAVRQQYFGCIKLLPQKSALTSANDEMPSIHLEVGGCNRTGVLLNNGKKMGYVLKWCVCVLTKCVIV